MAKNGKRILIALGGNAIKQANEKGTAEEQFKNVSITAEHIVRLITKMGKEDRLIITHGNGPQSGNLALQQDLAKDQIPPQPLDVVGAMTQGQIGYMFQNTLENMLEAIGHKVPVISVVNQVLVDKNDPEFIGENASKPVGNFLSEEEAMKMKAEKGWIVKKVKPNAPKPWRRVVPSPDPIANVEADAIKILVNAGAVVIASGGGGIPVYKENGKLIGVEAVIDKDLAGERLAEVVEADVFLILTDVEKAKLNYGKPNETPIDRMTVAEAKKYLNEGHFLAGSMGPKVKACIRFIEWGGKEAVITSLDKAVEALEGKTGTHIVSA
ncbi:MAG: carbamate kinase [Candidatus Methanomethylicia archaeon]|uniref:Carbamate kinase n=1 Tax=Candidatus Methanomethylicus mesodigestus TaxID=1867258 RepID=A0A7C3J519_9CREN|nr:carbamate kinase [Candidatus Methanomethylicia archaeon]